MATPSIYFKAAPDAASRSASLIAILKHLPQYKQNAFVAIKLTIGDKTARYQVSPDLVRLVVDAVKAQGARPFLFDTNVIYEGSRMNAVDHMNLAYAKGFTPERVGAPFIIADGVLGFDGREFTANYNHIKKIKVPSFVGVIDNLIVLSHITGHIMSSYAGAIKNVGMGMSCRPGKQIQHSSVKPRVIEKECVMCGACIRICPVKAIAPKQDKANINQKICVGCCECLCACRYDAIAVNWKTDIRDFYERMTEYAAAILERFMSVFCINFAYEITKECDCIAVANEPIICSDVGIVAGADIVAVDKATADLVTTQEDVFQKAQNHAFYHDQLQYAQKIKLGSLIYDLQSL